MNGRALIAKIVISLLTVGSIVGLAIYGPIPQDPAYHCFADARSILGIPNFWNVVSSLPMVIVGGVGFAIVAGSRFSRDERSAYAGLYSGSMLMGLGSVYYHLSPNNETLAMDRLGMALVFMPLLTVVVIEFVSRRLGSTMLVPLLLLGAGSVLYWIGTERAGAGDLRLYVLVQFLTMLVIPIILLGFQSKAAPAKAYWLAFLAYVVAKVVEAQDVPIYRMLGGIISGHSLKHLVVAAGILVLVCYHGGVYSGLDTAGEVEAAGS